MNAENLALPRSVFASVSYISVVLSWKEDASVVVSSVFTLFWVVLLLHQYTLELFFRRTKNDRKQTNKQTNREERLPAWL